MSYYRRCPVCRSYLDPGEICDCEKEAALDAANIQSGTAESEVSRHTFPSIVPEVEEVCQGGIC